MSVSSELKGFGGVGRGWGSTPHTMRVSDQVLGRERSGLQTGKLGKVEACWGNLAKYTCSESKG